MFGRNLTFLERLVVLTGFSVDCENRPVKQEANSLEATVRGAWLGLGSAVQLGSFKLDNIEPFPGEYWI